jgi:hypothetical protein
MSEIGSQIDASGVPEQKNVAVNEKSAPIDDIEGLKADFPYTNVTGLAVVEQGHVIPTTGERKITTRWEYWSYCLWSK